MENTILSCSTAKIFHMLSGPTQKIGSEVKIRIRHFKMAIGVIIMLPSIVLGSDLRILVSHDRIWTLSESDWSLIEGSEDFNPVTKAANVFTLDFAKNLGENDANFLGLEVLNDDYRREIVVTDVEEGGVIGQFSGSRPGFNFAKEKVGFLRINPAEIEDAFYVSELDGTKLQLICSGGFFEHYPIVSSPSFFYVFRSNSNQTLRISLDTSQADEPFFLKNRIVLAVWGDDKLILVYDRIAKTNLILDGSGEIISVIEIKRPHAAIEFSSNGKFVYVSIAKTVNRSEISDFGIYKIERGEVHIIQKNFSVGVGEISRYKGK